MDGNEMFIGVLIIKNCLLLSSFSSLYGTIYMKSYIRNDY